jgi:hypothetical protein
MAAFPQRQAQRARFLFDFVGYSRGSPTFRFLPPDDAWRNYLTTRCGGAGVFDQLDGPAFTFARTPCIPEAMLRHGLRTISATKVNRFGAGEVVRDRLI